MSLQQRVEGTTAGRVAISAAIVFTLLAIAVTNLPGTSHLNQSLSGKTQPYLNAIGLDQNWGVFAPDPRQEVLALKARITYSDGTSEIWEPPRRNALFGGYSDYRWRKLSENLLTNNNLSVGLQIARWIAREHRRRSQLPSKVTLIKRSADLPPPGPKAGKPLRFREKPVVDADIEPDALKEGRR